ncbi:hypothetical protein [Ideonella paludis]|uniref:Uncharacterized protein n=1 Tax=Ideonella paludis TaxID=1233411 RepID=A0ABS5DVC3_9BURK|nr:hypothetical protein [Ideonella paludis]MBQ0935094.1 hypothetical protein [Ideonella paludis]
MKKYLSIALLLAGFNAGAADLWCQGKVSRVLTYSSGELMITSSWRGDWTTICNVETPRAGIPVGVCKNWYSQLSAATVADREVIVYYSGVPDGISCSNLGTYGGAPVPGYVSLSK